LQQYKSEYFVLSNKSDFSLRERREREREGERERERDINKLAI
jgi:hypothetical protein